MSWGDKGFKSISRKIFNPENHNDKNYVQNLFCGPFFVPNLFCVAMECKIYFAARFSFQIYFA